MIIDVGNGKKIEMMHLCGIGIRKTLRIDRFARDQIAEKFRSWL